MAIPVKFTSSPTFKDLTDEAAREHKAAVQERFSLEVALREAKKKEEEAGRKLTRLNRIAYQASFSRDCTQWNLHQWRREDQDALAYGDPLYDVWCSTWELYTSRLDFKIMLSELSGVKRDKYEVQVKLSRRTLSERPSEIHGGYITHDFGADMYSHYTEGGYYVDTPGQELRKKFKDLDQAYAFVDAWKKRLEQDYGSEIATDREVRKLCLAATRNIMH